MKLYGKILEMQDTKQYNLCKEELIKKVDKSGATRYFKTDKCHDYLLDFNSDNYKINRIEDKYIDQTKYIGFSVAKK